MLRDEIYHLKKPITKDISNDVINISSFPLKYLLLLPFWMGSLTRLLSLSQNHTTNVFR